MGGKGSGGANGGPQYNPMNINPLGGDGQSGTQAATYIPGMGYGEGKKTLATQRAAKLAGNPVANVPGAASIRSSMNTDVIPLTAPTAEPGVAVTNGAKLGAGDGLEALNLPTTPQESDNPDINLIRQNYQVMEWWAQQPGATQATKDYIKYLGSIL
jgi:hypothetical protein